MDGIPNLKPSEIEPFLNVLEHIRDSGLLERFGFDLDINARLADVQAQVRQVALRWYSLKLQELQAAPGVNRALPLLLMTDELEKVAKQLDKRFPEPLLGSVHSFFFLWRGLTEIQPTGSRIVDGGDTDSAAHPGYSGLPETTIRVIDERTDSGRAYSRHLCAVSTVEDVIGDVSGILSRVSPASFVSYLVLIFAQRAD
jgi:hypothetical protein